MNKLYKPIYQYAVLSPNRGDQAIRIAIQRAIQEYIPEIPFAYFNCKGEILSEKRIEQFNQDASMLIIGGSGLYTNYPYESGWYFPCKTELFEKIKIPISLIGIGCNNNLKNDIFKGELSSKTKKSIKLMNDLSVVSTVRDKRTYDILKSFEVKNHMMTLDPANFLTPSANIRREKRVAINIAQHSPDLGRFDGTQETRNKNLDYFSKISKYLINKGYSVIFIAHDALEQSLIMDMKKLVPEMEYLNIDDIDLMLKEYARCQFSIGLKMHSNILSFASGTPFISVYYDAKSIEYMKLLNWDFGTNVFDDYYDTLKRYVDTMIENHAQYIAYFKTIKEIENKKFQKGIQQLCDIIKT